MIRYEHLELLELMVKDGYVNVQKHPTFDYYIYNYAQKTQFEGKWNVATLQARGLILNGRGEIIARPFKKFFNFQEHQNNQIPWHEKFYVLEKVDGSLGIAYVGEDGEVYMATRGSFTSDQAIRGTEFVETNDYMRKKIISDNSEFTHMFEIVYKENRVVVDYGDFEGLIYLGGVNKQNCEILFPHDSIISKPYSQTSTLVSNPLRGIYKEELPRIVEVYNVSDFNELLSHTKDNFEGYVVRFESGFTMKVKLDEYVRLHRLMTNVSNVSVWNALKNGDNIDSLIEDVPDEFYDWIKTIISDLTESFKSIEKKAYSVYEKYRDYERSYIAKKILHEAPKDIKPLAPIVFSMLDGKDYKETIWKMIRPEYQKPFYQSKDD